jgi:iron-sulfur cluster assembly accessory protein
MTKRSIVSLTERAVNKVKEFFSQSGYTGNMLRISLVRTHCMGGRGYSYKLAAEMSETEGDVAQDADGLRIVLRQADVPRLEGTVIDYNESLEGSGFSVSNPNATGKCPCGHHDLFE